MRFELRKESGAIMVNREAALAVLRHWFPSASQDDVEGAASAIAGLPEEWEEVTSKEEELGYHYSPKCVEICYLADQVDTGAQFRLFRKRRARSW
jgi:hypothetical protein